MIEPLDDALNALICDVASPLAGNLGETVQATERGLRIGVIELVKMLQRQSADSQFFDLVIELVDHYRRTNDDATAEAYFSPASIAAGNSLVEGVFGASRTNSRGRDFACREFATPCRGLRVERGGRLVAEVARARRVPGKAQRDILWVRASRGCFASLAPAAVWKARISGGQVNERRGAGQKKTTKCEALLVLARGGDYLDRRLGVAPWSRHAFEA